MSADGTIRLSVSIPEATSKQLDAFLPWGTKAEAVRALIDLLIQTQLTTNRYIGDDLIKGRCKLVVQNLNNGERHEQET